MESRNKRVAKPVGRTMPSPASCKVAGWEKWIGSNRVCADATLAISTNDPINRVRKDSPRRKKLLSIKYVA